MLDYTTDNAFLPHIKCASVDEAVAQLIGELESSGAVDDGQSLAAEVMRREIECSTAIGGGLVIPHARHSGARKVKLAVATLAQPLEIPSADNQPVDIVILLVGPNDDTRLMLWVLAQVARLVKNSIFLNDLRAAISQDELKMVFSKADQSPTE
ncbi:MAG: PTS sugar transporter subunit IIA [Gammaproteobacteria bacterium]|nr:PTS sugar transporter subunit IIA [Gammaproteobacteria bacterium]MCP4293387.1 PTS sugar transporter subunit IIA [bacterium]